MKGAESSWSLSAVVSRYISDKIHSLLQPYLENIIIDAQVGLQPEVALTDIMLREDALDRLALPLRVSKQSRVSLLKVTLPLTAYNREPVTVVLEKVRVFVVPNEVPWQSTAKNQEKLQRLAAWREQQRSRPNEGETKSFLNSLKETVLNNLCIVVKDMEVVYLDEVSLGFPCFVRLYVDLLKLETTNSQWQTAFSQSETETFRVLKVQGLSLAVVADGPEPRSGDLHDYYHRVALSERHYVLRPCSLTIKHKFSHAERSQSVSAEIGVLEFALSEAQILLLQHCMRFFAFKHSYARYHSLRPSLALKTEPKSWWRYLVRAYQLDLGRGKRRVDSQQQQNDYLDLFKRHQDIIHAPWLQPLKRAELARLRGLEEALPIRLLLNLRSYALAMLRQEAAVYAQRAGADGSSIGDLWSFYMQDFKESAAEQPIWRNSRSGDTFPSQSPNWKVKVSVTSLLLFLQRSTSREPRQPTLQIFSREECDCEHCQKKSFAGRQALPPTVMTLRSASSDHDSLVDSEEEKPEPTHEGRPLLPALRNLREYSTSFDNVKAILGVTSEKPDSKLFTEGTLLAVHLDRITAEAEGFGAQTKVRGRLGSLVCWDLQSLSEGEQRAQFLACYGLTSLLREAVERSMNDPQLFCTLRHFLTLHGLLGCFEFFVHHLEVSSTRPTTIRYCTCKHLYTPDRLFEAAFNDPESNCFLHMSPFQKPEDSASMQEVADRIETVFKEELLPRFLQNCARWVLPGLLLASVEQAAKKTQHLRDSRPAGEAKPVADFDLDLAEATTLQVTLEPPRLTLTNTTLAALLQWLQLDFYYKPFNKAPLKDSFTERLRALSPSVAYLMALCQQIRQPEERSSPLPVLSLEVEIKSAEIQLLDHGHMQKYREVPAVLLQLQRLGVRLTSPVPAPSLTQACYLKTEAEAEGFQVQSLGCALLRTSVRIIAHECLLQHTLELPDRVLDIHIPELQVEINSTLLPVLTFLRGIQGPRREESSQTSIPAKSDFTQACVLLMGKQFPGLDLYWQLKHLKYLTAVYFTLGSVARPGGLLVLFNSAAFAAPVLSVQVPLIVATFQEKVFTMGASVLLSEVRFEPEEGESIRMQTKQGFVLPRIPAELFPLLPLATGALQGEVDLQLQEICVFKHNKLPKLPNDPPVGERHKERASLSLEESKALRRSLRSSYFEPKSAGISQLKFHINSLRWHLERPLLQSRLLAALAGVGVILDTADRLQEPSPENPQPRRSKPQMKVLVNVRKVEVESMHPNSGFLLSIQDFTLKMLPETRVGLLSSLSFDLVGVALELRSEGEGLNYLRTSVLSVSGALEKHVDKHKLTGGVRVGSVAITCADNLNLLAIPSSARQDAVADPIGESAVLQLQWSGRRKKLQLHIRPVVVLLELERLGELKDFFKRQASNRRAVPVTPNTLLSGPEVFVQRPPTQVQLNLGLERVQALFCAKNTHFLRLTLEGVTLQNSEDCFPGSIRSVRLEPKYQEYSNLLRGPDPMVTFEVRPAAKLLRLRGSSLQYIFINRSLEDLLGFIKELKAPKKLSDPPPTLDFMVELICEKATIIVPSTSEGKDQVIIEVAHVELNNALRSLSKQLPQPLQPGFEVVKKKEVTVDLSEQVKEFLCDVISVQGEGGVCTIRRGQKLRKLCTVARGSVEVYSAPSLPREVLDQWNLDVEVRVALEAAHLTASLSDLSQLTHILESNIDEKSDLFLKIFKWEKTDFRFQWDEGGVDMCRWVAQHSECRESPIAMVQALDEREEES